MRNVTLIVLVGSLLLGSGIGCAPSSKAQSGSQSIGPKGASINPGQVVDSKIVPDAVIRHALEVAAGKVPLHIRDLESITTLRLADDSRVYFEYDPPLNLTGLEHCTSLRLLDLEDGDVVSLAPLKSLPKLDSLRIHKVRPGGLAEEYPTHLLNLACVLNEHESLPPGLIASLRYLDLTATYTVVDLAGLSGARELRTLILDQVSVDHLEVLGTLPHLEILSLRKGQGWDGGPPEHPITWSLGACPRLRVLDLEGQAIHDLSFLAGLTSLEMLDLDSLEDYKGQGWDGLHVKEVSPLANLVHLTDLRLCGIMEYLGPMDGANYIPVGEIADVRALANLTSLRTLDVSGQLISDVVPITSLQSLWFLSLAGNPIKKPLVLPTEKYFGFLDLRQTGVSVRPTIDRVAHVDMDDASYPAVPQTLLPFPRPCSPFPRGQYDAENVVKPSD